MPVNVYPTPAALSKWIASSHKGNRLVYHLGHLLHDRKIHVTLARTGGSATVDVLPLQALQAAVMEAYREGLVILAQRKVAPDTFEYLAIRTRKYVKPPLVGEEK
jgi:hypothetical protein